MDIMMRCCALLVLFLHCLGASGFPLFEMSSKGDEALRKALNEINTRYTQNHLFRVSKASFTRIAPLGLSTYDVTLKFRIRETNCRKDSGVDPQGCTYKRGFFVLEAGCFLRLHVTDRSTDVVTLKCTPTQSSSSESSEEMETKWHYDINRFAGKDPESPTSASVFDKPRRSQGGFFTGKDFSNYLE